MTVLELRNRLRDFPKDAPVTFYLTGEDLYFEVLEVRYRKTGRQSMLNQHIYIDEGEYLSPQVDEDTISCPFVELES